MEADNLKTASAYINNQLLSRGLLRNGQAIEFARPKDGEGGVSGTMGRVMAVVNDLILRRDRDATQRETLSTTIRTLRADALRQTAEIERLTIKNAESARKAGIAEAAERAARLQLRSAEAAARGMKEEMARMKVLVQQTRSQCANEVRKREKVIEGLKRHVGEGGRPRGSGKAVGVRTVDVVPWVGEKEKRNRDSCGVREEGYDLRSETNEFLTDLARGLSEENEIVGGMLKRTVETLKELSGVERDEQHDGVLVNVDGGAYEALSSELEEVLGHLRTLLTNPSFVPLEEVEVREEEIARLRDGWEKMESRWKEAVTMMNGWRQRMARSGQTVNLEELQMGLLLSPLKPGGDNERMGLSMIGEEEEEGDTQADIDAMSDSEMDNEDVIYDEPLPDPADHMVEEEDFEEEESSLFHDEPSMPHQEPQAQEEVQQHQQEQTLDSLPSSSPGPAPQLSPLRETNGNAPKASSYPNGPQKDTFTTIIEENTYDLLSSHDTKTPPQKSPQRKEPTTLRIIEPSPPPPSSLSLDDSIDILQTSTKSSRQRSRSPEKPPTSRSAIKPSSSSSSHLSTAPASTQPARSTPNPKLRNLDSSSRLARPNDVHQRPQQSPLTMATIAAKLAATEREADAARVRAKLKAARLGRGGKIGSTLTSTSTSTNANATSKENKKSTADEISKGDDREVEQGARVEAEAEVDVDVDVGKKRKAGRTQGGRANRRRSTLSPWEMESLILGGLGKGSPLKDV